MLNMYLLFQECKKEFLIFVESLNIAYELNVLIIKQQLTVMCKTALNNLFDFWITFKCTS